MIAAAEKPADYSGGWEDSTMGNIFASYIVKVNSKPVP
jgi:hypothetical protein